MPTCPKSLGKLCQCEANVDDDVKDALRWERTSVELRRTPWIGMGMLGVLALAGYMFWRGSWALWPFAALATLILALDYVESRELRHITNLRRQELATKQLACAVEALTFRCGQIEAQHAAAEKNLREDTWQVRRELNELDRDLALGRRERAS